MRLARHSSQRRGGVVEALVLKQCVQSYLIVIASLCHSVEQKCGLLLSVDGTRSALMCRLARLHCTDSLTTRDSLVRVHVLQVSLTDADASRPRSRSADAVQDPTPRRAARSEREDGAA